VVAKKVDPRGTMFKAMNYEEKAMYLEQAVQEIGRHPAGAVAYELEEGISDPQEDIEAVGAHQESPTQIRDLPEDQNTQERGALLYQQTQLLMKWMQDDPYLIIRPMISTTIQSIPTESRDPSSIVPDNTNGLGNPESTTSSINPLEGGAAQPETGRVSIETQAPNPLSTLIHIYSDDESLEPAHDTPVWVQEEEVPKKTPSPEPEVQDKQVSQKETKGGLEKNRKLKRIQMINLNWRILRKDHHKRKLDSSTADGQVSNKHVPDISIFPNIQIPDERQIEVRPTRQNDEVREPTLEHIYTMGSLGDNLTWGDQQIPEPVDEVAYIYAISYDQKRKAIVQRSAKK
jgi:hypothetical protein